MKDRSSPNLRLDDLYKMTAHIYGDRNSERSREATFSHFVEVCGALTAISRNKRHENFSTTDALCKSLGWYFPLLAKMRIRSAERLIFRKFPGVCPYCRKSPHDEIACKQVKGTKDTLKHSEVIDIFEYNWKNRPIGINEWQVMFSNIYPRSIGDTSRSTIGLFEEIGELAESVRVFDAHPHYFLGEAADIFSYIMGIANEHAIKEAKEDRLFNLEEEFLLRYPGLCTQCGSKVCTCPAIPAATIGRMAKELDIGPKDGIFVDDVKKFSEEGAASAHIALETMGGYAGLLEKLPFDRGDANHGLIQLCLKIAAAVELTRPETASTLRAEAIKIGEMIKDAGTPRISLNIHELIETIRLEIRSLDQSKRSEIESSSGLSGELGEILGSFRVLFVACSPVSADSGPKLHKEQRSISEALRLGPNGNRISFDELPAATTDDLRRRLLKGNYDAIHFSGHSDGNNLIFETSEGRAQAVSIEAISELISRYPTIKFVILNACKSVKLLSKSISPVTIGMDDAISDSASIAFSTGFYDALAAEIDIEKAYKEGISAVNLSNNDSSYIRMILRDDATSLDHD